MATVAPALSLPLWAMAAEEEVAFLAPAAPFSSLAFRKAVTAAAHFRTLPAAMASAVAAAASVAAVVAAVGGGGGGGGYSGGGAGGGFGGENHFSIVPGGGGGSFDAGIDQILLADLQMGNGEVIITELAAAVPEPRRRPPRPFPRPGRPRRTRPPKRPPCGRWHTAGRVRSKVLPLRLSLRFQNTGSQCTDCSSAARPSAASD